MNIKYFLIFSAIVVLQGCGVSDVATSTAIQSELQENAAAEGESYYGNAVSRAVSVKESAENLETAVDGIGDKEE